MATARGRPTERPFVQVNCATSADGRLAFARGRRALLSGPRDLARVQGLRADSEAILVGVGTVLADDPSLRVHWDLLGRPPGREPLRVVLDSHGRTPATARVLDALSRTVVVTDADCRREFAAPVETERIPGGPFNVPEVLKALGRRGVHRVLVEGGAHVIASFLRERAVDRMTVFMAPTLIGGATAPPLMSGPETADESGSVPLRLESVERLDEGLLITWTPVRRSR